MNRYQKRKTSEIRQIMKMVDRNNPEIKKEHGSVTIKHCSYKRAKFLWNFMKHINQFSPCEDCNNASCKGPYNKLVFCPNNR